MFGNFARTYLVTKALQILSHIYFIVIAIIHQCFHCEIRM